MKPTRFVLPLLVLAAAVARLPAQPAISVTAAGKIITTDAGGRSPWADDVLKLVGPEYTRWQRERYNQGRGAFRATLDLKTGAIRSVVVRKSTGHQALDRSAIVALKQWRFKPGKWKELDVFISFEMARSRREAEEKVRRLRERKGRRPAVFIRGDYNS